MGAKTEDSILMGYGHVPPHMSYTGLGNAPHGRFAIQA